MSLPFRYKVGDRVMVTPTDPKEEADLTVPSGTVVERHGRRGHAYVIQHDDQRENFGRLWSKLEISPLNNQPWHKRVWWRVVGLWLRFWRSPR